MLDPDTASLDDLGRELGRLQIERIQPSERRPGQPEPGVHTFGLVAAVSHPTDLLPRSGST
jgi:hypothetical protein